MVEESWEQLLALAAYPQVYVKISAAFRNIVNAEDTSHAELSLRLVALIAAFGASRLMWGSDFPFVMQQPASDGEGDKGSPYAQSVDTVRRWGVLTDEELQQVFGGAVEGLLGVW